ncbi:hypothetical protein niasHT_005600 [Heterodera trifolii]|uniref:Uncharacterized protein n=1 Tax=Heterodera trifolii TaxID=157864 RepID=A0ABD2M3U5_9BILA
MSIDTVHALNFVHRQEEHNRKSKIIDEENQISSIIKLNIVGPKKYNLGNLRKFIQKLNDQILKENEKLMEAKKIAKDEQEQMHERYLKQEIKNIQLDHPFQKYNIITMTNVQPLLIRHGQRLDNIEGISSDCKKQLESKKDFLLSNISDQDLPLSEMSGQEVPLTKHGFEQAKELGEWFKSIPIDQIYSSPFQRTVATANGILERRNDGIYLHIEPGLTEFYKPCQQKIEYLNQNDPYKLFKFSNSNYSSVYNKRLLELGIMGRPSLTPEELEMNAIQWLSKHFVIF